MKDFSEIMREEIWKMDNGFGGLPGMYEMAPENYNWQDEEDKEDSEPTKKDIEKNTNTSSTSNNSDDIDIPFDDFFDDSFLDFEDEENMPMYYKDYSYLTQSHFKNPYDAVKRQAEIDFEKYPKMEDVSCFTDGFTQYRFYEHIAKHFHVDTCRWTQNTYHPGQMLEFVEVTDMGQLSGWSMKIDRTKNIVEKMEYNPEFDQILKNEQGTIEENGKDFYIHRTDDKFFILTMEEVSNPELVNKMITSEDQYNFYEMVGWYRDYEGKFVPNEFRRYGIGDYYEEDGEGNPTGWSLNCEIDGSDFKVIRMYYSESYNKHICRENPAKVNKSDALTIFPEFND